MPDGVERQPAVRLGGRVAEQVRDPAVGELVEHEAHESRGEMMQELDEQPGVGHPISRILAAAVSSSARPWTTPFELEVQHAAQDVAETRPGGEPHLDEVVAA